MKLHKTHSALKASKHHRARISNFTGAFPHRHTHIHTERHGQEFCLRAAGARTLALHCSAQQPFATRFSRQFQFSLSDFLSVAVGVVVAEAECCMRARALAENLSRDVVLLIVNLSACAQAEGERDVRLQCFHCNQSSCSGNRSLYCVRLRLLAELS